MLNDVLRANLTEPPRPQFFVSWTQAPRRGMPLLIRTRAAAAVWPRRPRVYFEEWDEPMISAIQWVSQLIGTSRETVTRILGEMRSRGILSIKGSTMVIHNRAALEAMVLL